jgi:hypothetical protein
MKKLVKRDPTTRMSHTLKMAFLIALRQPAFNLFLNLGMLLLNGITCVWQFWSGNYILGNILLVSTVSCVSAVAYWTFFVWDRRNNPS